MHVADCPAVSLDLCIYTTNKYPNVKQLSWAINYRQLGLSGPRPALALVNGQVIKIFMTLLSKPLHIRETRTVSWITRFSKSLENNFLLRGDNIKDDEADNGDDDDNDDDDDYDYEDDDDT